MNVLSLFDGIGTGRLALERAGIKLNNYFASEIEEASIKVAKANYPDIVEIGDVTKVTKDSLPVHIDLMIGGSPCQGFSASGKGLNFEDPRSKLFFEFVRLLEEVKPKYFLLENVKMKKEWSDIITSYLGVEPIEINSKLVSAQNRVRLYWTNIPNVIQPKDKNIKLIDILESVEYTHPAAIRGRRLDENGHNHDSDRSIPIVQCLEVRNKNTDKSNCLTTVDKDNVLTSLPAGKYPDCFNRKLPFRYYTLKELCRLQTMPDNYLDMIPESKARKALGNGWTADVIAHIFNFLPEAYDDKMKKRLDIW